MRQIAYALVGDNRLTGLMQCLDVFEHDKWYGVAVKISGDIRPGKTDQETWGEVWQALSQREKNPLLALFVPNVEGACYRRADVKVVSDGKRWFLVEDWIKGWKEGSS
jgi:hypothetical protein